MVHIWNVKRIIIDSWFLDRGGRTRVISHMAMECVAYNVYIRLLTFNLSLHFSVYVA